jgi:DedD protein
MALEERLKQRLLGGAVLVALIVIFVPMLIDEPVDSRVVADHRIPVKPAILEKPIPKILPPELPSAPTADTTITEPPPMPEPPSQPVKPTVTHSTTQAERSSPTSWMIQVASLTVRENATKLVKDLKKADMPAQMESVKVDGKTHYRVRVGPEVDFKTAERMADKIKKDFKLAPKVLRYPE